MVIENQVLREQVQEIEAEKLKHVESVKDLEEKISELQENLNEVHEDRNKLKDHIDRIKDTPYYELMFNSPPQTLVEKLKLENAKLQAFVQKLQDRMDTSRSRSPGSSLASTPSPSPRAPTDLERQVQQLRETLEEAERKHRDIICTYRTHLLASVQGCIDPEVKQALLHIVKLRSEEESDSR